jgi:zinc transport system ATP-binding protein
MSLLACQNLVFSYDGKEVLSEINFHVEQGDYLCIVGENGAGKSTLLKGLLGLKGVSSGKILTGDGLKPNEIGYLPQQTQVQKDFPASVYEVVLSGCLNNLEKRIFYSRENRRKALHWMELLGLLSLKNKCYRELSGGQQQRVLLARALCATKKMLLLDEPVTGLDPVVSQEFYGLVKMLNQEEHISIIMVSHDIDGAIKDASHVLHLGKKQLFYGSVDDYRESEWGKHFLMRGEADD